VQRARDFDSFPKPVDDSFELSDMYSRSIVQEQLFHTFLDNFQDVEYSRNGVLERVTDYARSIGNGVVVAGGIGVEECEKEVHAQSEQQEEKEVESTSQHPRSQVDWDYQLIFKSQECEKLFGSHFHRLESLIDKYGLREIKNIRWSKNVYCTLNFWESIENATECSSLSPFFRLVDPLIVFPDGRVVLISLYELDNILPLWWELSRRPNISLDHVFRLVSDCPQLGDWSLPVSSETLTSLKLFRGDAKYDSDEEKLILRSMLEDLHNPIDTVKYLLSSRNRLNHYEQSDLAKEAFLLSIPS